MDQEPRTTHTPSCGWTMIREIVSTSSQCNLSNQLTTSQAMTWAQWKKWSLTMVVSIATLAVSFVSSAYSGGVEAILVEFNTSTEVVTLGISLFVLGFALGPLLWAPLSELYGRQILFCVTYAMLTIFNAGCAGARNIQTLIILRFFAGTFGSSPLTVSDENDIAGSLN